MSSFSERLRDLRTQRNITQAQLARVFHKAESTVRMWELGKNEPDNQTLSDVANYFNVSVDFLLGREPARQNDDVTLPPEFVIMARKTGELTEEQKKRIYRVLDSTIDNVLAMLEMEKGDG